MKTFTTYAEKKAKQFLNLLQGYTKGIRFTAILILLLMGVNSAWANGGIGYKGVKFTKDGTTTGWYNIHNVTWDYVHNSYECRSGKSGVTDFNNADFGIVTSLKLHSFVVIGWTDNSDWVSGQLKYRTYLQSASAGNYNIYNVGNYETYCNATDVLVTSGNNRVVGKNGTMDVTLVDNNTTPGKYYLQLQGMGRMRWCNGDFNANNGSEVKASYTVPGFTTTSTSQTFDNTTVNNNSSKTISFGTHYGDALATNNCAISGTNKTEFSVTSITESGVTVKFAPTSAGSKSATLTITDAHEKTCTITLSGTAILPTYTVTFGVHSSGNGTLTAKAGSTSISSGASIDEGTTVVFTASPSTGYQIEGWYSNSTCTTSLSNGTNSTYTISSLTADKTVYVKFEELPATSHNITYTPQKTGWTYGNSNPTTAEEGATVTFVVNPTAGYSVSVSSDGPALTGPNANNQYTFTMPTKDVKITVEAKPEQYTVTLDKQSGEGGTSSVTATYAAAMPTITPPTRIGYTFNGYFDATSGGTKYYDANGNSAKNWDKTSKTTLYAQWTANKYTVKFNANNGTGTMSNQSFTYDVEKALTANAFTRKGYTFLGWAKSSSATTATYTDKQTVKNLTDNNNSTVNLYAVWQALPPTPVILKPNDEWKQANARYAIYYWGDGTDNNGWVELTDLGCSGEYFTGEVPASYLDFKFVRLDPDGKTDAAKNNGLHWDYKWNETNNLTAPAADKNMYDMTVVSSSHLLFKSNSNWTADGARTAAYFFGNGEKWISMTDIGNGFYYCDKPSGYTKVIFVRMNGSNQTNDWNDNNKWNQTADLTLPTDGKNLYTISGALNNLSGTWSASADNVFDNTKWTTYTVPTYTITINAPEAGSIAVTVGGNTTTVTNTPKQITNIAAGSTFTVAYTPSTGFKLGHSEINGTKEEYTGAGTYTVCGPVDITAHFVTKEKQVVYLRPNDNWLAGNAIFYAYVFNRYGGNEWIELVTEETDYTGAYGCTIPAGYSDVIFVRINPTAAEPSWDDDVKWNQTIDYVIPINTTKNAPPMSAMSSGDDYVISINTTNNRFIIGEKITAEGADKDKYQGSWEASDTPIYGIPGDWQNDWKADEYPLMGPDGLVTVNITQTNDTLGFKVYQYPYGSDDKSAQWLGNNGTMVRGGEGVHEGGWTMETSTNNNCGLGVDIAGDYVFAFNIRDKKLTVTYPKIPAPTTSIKSEQRVFEDEVLAYGWVAGDGTEANPYQLYADEAARITLSPIPAVEGLTAYYQFGNNEEQTSNVFDWKYISSQATTMEVKAYYKNAMGAKSAEATVNTSYFKTLALPFYLMTQPKYEINIDRIAEGENILVQFRSDSEATVDLYLNDTESTPLTTITDKNSYDYEYDVPNDTTPCILTFIAKAQGAGHHGRIFEVKADIAIYKNVIIKVNDPDGWVKNVYMWRDYSDAVLTPWPGDPVLQNYGTWRVFSVKYPYYDRFIINDGNSGGSTQTRDWVLPADDTCYELLDPENNGSDKAEDKGKYGLKVADCPGNLMVNNIKDTTIMEGEQIVVMPEIFVGLGYKLSDVEITHLNADNPSSVRVMQSGNNIIVSGYGIGSSNVTVSFTLGTETITKTFTVTVVKNTHITIQVKVPKQFGNEEAQYQWKDGTKIGIRYWGAGIDGTDLLMDYAYTDATYHYAQAQLPLGTDGKINFHFYYESHSDENAKWRQTTNIEGVSTSGCYKLKQGNDYYRHSDRDGDYCYDDTNYAQYQVKVFLPTAGKQYSSNIVTNTTDILSFFAPGQNETGYRAGTVQLYKNGKMVAAINPTMFAESNVYTATVNETGDGLGNVAPYSGNFYIRTYGTSYKNVGFNNGKGWNSIKDLTTVEKDSVRFTYFISREGEFYNHYWVQAMNTGPQYDGKDVSACVANEYNDDLAGKLTQGKGTNEEGDIKVGTNKVINVRFGYDPRTNYFGRAIIKGSEYDNYLNIHCDNAYKDKNCSTKLPYGNSVLDNKMQDISNWCYQRDFYVPITNSYPSASLYVEATSPSTEMTVTDHLLGYVINEVTGEETTIPVQRTVIGSGTTNGTYLIRVVYDFKTNRIIAAWLPQGTVDVKEDRTLNADVLFVRQENNEVPQIQLAENGKIRSLESMFFAIELLRGGNDPKDPNDPAHPNNRHQEQYWFTLPFDCKVGSISGVPGYMQIWGIQRYRGDLRAQKGWYAETPTFWEWLDAEDVMLAGEGYLLVFDKKNAPFEEIEVDKKDANGDIIPDQKEKISMMRLYFPSMTSGFDMQQQSAEHLTRTYENHTCTLTLHDRYKQDSNWKVIGTTSYNNAGITGYTQDTDPEYKELSAAPSFRYKYEYTMSNDNKTFTYKYTPENGKTATYQSFFGYMVQFAGTINWQPIMSETVPEGIAARRRVAEGERTSYTTRLEFADANGEKQDQAFVALDEKATTDFDQNKDLNKVINRGNNIYTMAENIAYAGNTLPMKKQTVPVGVVVATAGEYTFRMPDGTDGISVILVDNQTGAHTNMLLDEYTVILEAGTYENRFSLVLDPQRTSTEVENVGDGYGDGVNGNGTEGIKKYIIDGQLFIRTANGLFDAKGQRM